MDVVNSSFGSPAIVQETSQVETQVETTETQVQSEVQTETQTGTQIVNETPAETSTETSTQSAPVEQEDSFSIGSTGAREESVVNPLSSEIDIEKIFESHKDKLIEKLGLDEFDLEFSKYRKQGGDPYEYLKAKSFDWNKVSDVDIVKGSIKEKYSELTEDDLEVLYEAELKKYGLHPDSSEDEQRVGKVLLKAEAHKLRSAKVEEQKKFVIPEVQKQEQLDLVAPYKALVESNPVTRELLESKKVVLGSTDKFTFNIENPTDLVKLQYDADVQRKYLFNEKGEPDLKKQYAMAVLAVIGPDAFAEKFINYGKRLGKKDMVEEGQNIQRPISQTPGSPMTEADAMRQAKVGTVGKI